MQNLMNGYRIKNTVKDTITNHLILSCGIVLIASLSAITDITFVTVAVES